MSLGVHATKEFARFARKAGLTATALLRAAEAVAGGRFDADLGGGVFKQRVARRGGGKSAGFRTIILFRAGKHCVFAHGFSKSDKANISSRELDALRRLADLLLAFSAEQLHAARASGDLIEIRDDDDEEG